MKALLILAILATFGVIFFQYSRNKDLKKLFIALVSLAVTITFAVLGNLTRPVMPIFLSHIILIILSWSGVMFYLAKERYYWWLIFSPAVTIGLFLLLEFLAGSGNEIG
ncbi:MAG TPA: hypothetical protein VIN02_01975 [Sulfurovum sp.]